MLLSKNDPRIETLREGGSRLATIMEKIVDMVAPDVSTEAIDAHARKLVAEGGDKAAFLGYQPQGSARPYPAAICVSVNEEVVHGIPNETPRALKEGDVITLDMGLVHERLITDMAFTVGVGRIEKSVQKLIDVAREALNSAIDTARAGNTTGDIGHIVEEIAKKYGFSVPRELGGHGVGEHVHEQPFIPNFGQPGSGVKLEKGMVLAIEPIIVAGKGIIELDNDGYTYKTRDKSRATQFEHTVIVTDDKPEILTQ